MSLSCAPVPGLVAKNVAKRTLQRALYSLAWDAVMSLGGVHSQLPPEGGTVALTFDDGPDPTYTPRLLDVLDRLSVPATFFLVGRAVEQHPALVRDIVSGGHAVGSHSYSHPDPWTMGAAAIARDYHLGRKILEQVCGMPAPLFRPPKGHVDAVGAATMRISRLRPWLWTVDSHDWEPDASATSVESRLVSVAPGDVVLFHDGLQGPLAPSALDRSVTVEVVSAVVPRLRAAGAIFTTLA